MPGACVAQGDPFTSNLFNCPFFAIGAGTVITIHMTDYELLLLFTPEIKDADLEAAIAPVRELIHSHDGKITREDTWGRRKLAYEINHQATGLYVLIEFQMTGPLLTEIDTALRLMPNVLRHQIVHRIPRMSINEDTFMQPEWRKAKSKADGSLPESAKPAEEKTAEPVDAVELDKKLDILLDEENIDIR